LLNEARMPDEQQNRRVIVTLHGIRTYGRWQERLRRILSRDPRWQQENAEVLVYRYGFFTLFSFLIPFLRNLAVKQFRDYLESLFGEQRPDRVDIVAHSFGSYLAIEALASPKLAGGVHIHTAILCGSVLPPNRNLSQLLGPRRPIGRIINECGTGDAILLLTLAVLGVGMAGRLGLHGLEGRTLCNRFHRVGHSGYFEQIGGRPYDGFMRRWWLPLLLSEELPCERDRRPDRPPFSDRVWRLLGENDGTVTVSLYAVILFFLAGTFGYLWREAEAERKVAVSNETQALIALSRVATVNHRTVDAVKLALAAWPRRDRDWWFGGDDRPKLETALQALSEAVSTDPGLTRQMRHAGPVTGALLTRDARRILSWSEDRTLRFWDAATGHQIGPAMTHRDAVRRALLTSDERRIISWDDRDMRLWDANSGQQIGAAMEAGQWLFGGALLSKDEQRIISWAGDELRLWDAATGRPIDFTMKGERKWIRGARLTEDGRRVITWGGETVQLWDVATGEQIGSTTLHDLTPDECKELHGYYVKALQGCPSDEVAGVLLTADQRRIVSWGGDELRLGAAMTGQQIGPIMKHRHTVRGALLIKNENRILSWTTGGILRLWDAGNGNPIGLEMHSREVNGALLTRDERRILSWSEDGRLQFWDAADGHRIDTPTPMSHGSAVSGAFLTRDERRILSWGGDELRLWDAATSEPIDAAAAIKHGGVKGAVLTDDGRRVLSWSGDGSLRLRDIATGQRIDAAIGHADIKGVLLSRDERRVLVSSRDGSLRLRDASTGQQIGQTMQHQSAVYGVHLSRDERRILSWDRGELRLWNAATGGLMAPAMKHPLTRPMPEGKLAQMMDERDEGQEWTGTYEGEVSEAVFADDERRIASLANDGTLRLWDATNGEPIGRSVEPKIDGIVLSRDSRRILSWHADELRWWNASNGQQIGSMVKYEHGRIEGVLLTTDEQRIIVWGGVELRLVNAATGRQIGPSMKYQQGRIGGARTTRDEHRILAWSGSELRLWDAATGRQIGATMKIEQGPVDGALLTEDGQHILSWNVDQLRLWDAATSQQIGPAMRHYLGRVYGALLTKDGRRALSWDGVELRQWDIGWPAGNLLEVACALLPDRELATLSNRYGLRLTDPICGAIARPDWSAIEHAPTEAAVR
jgi:WD40 repeat protein